MHQTTAFLLRKYRLSEASLILIWWTEEYGKIKTTAQGALKPGGRFSGRLELFKKSYIAFSLNKKSDLHILKEITLSSLEDSISKNYLALLTASYFSELSDLLTEQWHPIAEVFDLLERAFDFLKNQSPTIRAIEHFEKSLTKALGVYDPTLPIEYSLRNIVTHLPKNREKLFCAINMKRDKRVLKK